MRNRLFCPLSEDALQLYRKYYDPTNAVIVVTVDFSSDRLLPFIAASFGSILSNGNQKNTGTRIWRKWWNIHRTSALVLYERGKTGGMGGDRKGEKTLIWLAVSAVSGWRES